VNLRPGQRIAVDMRLEPLRGLVIVHSEPSRALVRIAGADRGSTPLLVTDLPVGRHRVEVSSPGYVPKEVDFELRDRTPAKVAVTLASSSARLEVSSEPPGAAVTLNGILAGQLTPCTIERVAAGESRLEISLEGYEPYTHTFQLAPGQSEKLTAALKPIPATLTVVSIPDKARIYVDNQFRGETPITLDGMPPGTCRVRAEKEGFETLARDVELKRATKVTEEFRLEGNAGSVQITTEPAGVSVLLDGQARGVTSARSNETDLVSDPLLIEMVTVGPHEVQLTRKGYYDLAVKIAVEKGKTAALHETLRRRFIADYEVRTATAVFQGVLVEVDPRGNVKIETRPGVFKTLKAEEIKSRGPIRTQSP
jgi:hypothetical protein